MAISVNPLTSVIFVPKADLTLLQSSPEIRELNLNSFRLELKSWEDDEGITLLVTHNHNTEVALAGLIYARTVEIQAPYTVEFEDGQYTVNCVGANHNLSDVKVTNQVSLIVNNAAGLISNAQIEFSSFNGGVTIDVLSSNVGTVFPVGTPQKPVNNVDDALLIASVRGFTKLFIVGDVTFTTGHNLANFEVEGSSSAKSTITIDSAAVVDGVEIRNGTVVGTLDATALLENCSIGTISFFEGTIRSCELKVGVITLGGTADFHLVDCHSGVAGGGVNDTPEIDLGGGGRDILIRNYTGGIKLSNGMNALDELSADIFSGQIVLDSTINDGTFTFRGQAKMTDNSTGSALVNTDDLLSPSKLLTVFKFLGLK